jgi:hypothetical protein
MKTLISSIAFTLLAVSAASAATLNVNNNPNRPTGHYATIAEAVNAASSGDILLIHGSQTTYAAATIKKRLEIIGSGYSPRDKERGWRTVISSISFGQIVGSSSSGSIIKNCLTSISCEVNINNITIQNNELSNLAFNGTGLLCENNVFTSGVTWEVTGSNCQIRNNLFWGRGWLYIISNGSPSIIFTNNTLINPTGWAFNGLKSVIMSNNIFYGISPFGMTVTTQIENNTFSKNLTLGTANDAFQGGVGNIVLDNNGNNNNLVNIDPLMTSSTPTTVTPIYNLDFRLRANSPCRNAGTDGTDIGITGGNSPMIYPLSGEPRLGIIKTMTILNPVVPIGGTLRVQLTAKTRN